MNTDKHGFGKRAPDTAEYHAWGLTAYTQTRGWFTSIGIHLCPYVVE